MGVPPMGDHPNGKSPPMGNFPHGGIHPRGGSPHGGFPPWGISPIGEYPHGGFPQWRGSTHAGSSPWVVPPMGDPPMGSSPHGESPPCRVPRWGVVPQRLFLYATNKIIGCIRSTPITCAIQAHNAPRGLQKRRPHPRPFTQSALLRGGQACLERAHELQEKTLKSEVAICSMRMNSCTPPCLGLGETRKNARRVPQGHRAHARAIFATLRCECGRYA